MSDIEEIKSKMDEISSEIRNVNKTLEKLAFNYEYAMKPFENFRERQLKERRNIKFNKNIDSILNKAVLNFDKGNYNEAEKLYQEAFSIAIDLDINQNEYMIITLFGIAHSLFKTDRVEQGTEYLENILKINPEHTGALDNLADAYNQLGYYDKAIETAKKAMKYDKSDFLIQTNSRVSIGYSFLKKDNLKKAVKYFKESIEYSEGEPSCIKVFVISLLNLGLCQYEMKEYDESIKNLAKAIDIGKANSFHELVANAYLNISNSLFKAQGESSSRKASKKCIEYAKLIKNWHFVSLAYDNLGMNYIKSKKYNQAIESCFKSIEFAKKIDNFSTIGCAYKNIVEAYMKMKDFEKAIFYSKKAINNFIKAEDWGNIASIYNNLGAGYIDNNQPKKALDVLKKSIEYGKKSSDSDLIIKSYYNLGAAWSNLHDLDNMNEAFLKAIDYLDQYDKNAAEFYKRIVESFCDFCIGSNTDNLMINKELIDKLSIIYNNTSQRFKGIILNSLDEYEKNVAKTHEKVLNEFANSFKNTYSN